MREPDSGEDCLCGHSYGDHTNGVNGPCSYARNVDAYGTPRCACPHWRDDAAKLVDDIEGTMLVDARIAKPNPAAHDAWQLALQHLEPLRAAIARAREAGEGDE